MTTYTPKMSFNAAVVGTFTVDTSALDGTDGLYDVGLSDGTYLDVSNDAQDPYQIVFGTDSLMATAQAASLTFTVARVDDPGYWNPRNPASVPNSYNPGFVEMRPVRLDAVTGAGAAFPCARMFIRRANWKASTRACEIYAEDFLFWASKVSPIVATTGPTNVGAVFRLLVQLIDPTLSPIADPGISLDDFSADGTKSVPQILADLLAVDLGTVYVGMDGNPVYRQADYVLLQKPVATITITDQASEEETGLDADSLGTRITVEKTDPATGDVLISATVINTATELDKGRADLPSVSSPYVLDGAGAAALASELVFRGINAKPPIVFTLADVDATTETLILSSPPLTRFTVNDPFGDTVGDVIAQRIQHTISTGLHEAEYTSELAVGSVFTVDTSALDGPDGLRYP
jgi:hypothetical protein